MRYFCLLLTCTCLCGCFFQTSQKPLEKPSATAQVQLKVQPAMMQAPKQIDLRDPQPKNNVGWPVTIIICSLFLFMPLLAHRRLK